MVLPAATQAIVLSMLARRPGARPSVPRLLVTIWEAFRTGPAENLERAGALREERPERLLFRGGGAESPPALTPQRDILDDFLLQDEVAVPATPRVQTPAPRIRGRWSFMRPSRAQRSAEQPQSEADAPQHGCGQRRDRRQRRQGLVLTRSDKVHGPAK